MTEVSPTQNYGTTLTMEVSSNVPSANETARSFLHFDISSLPADAVIYSATLRLWPTTVPTATRTYDVHPVTDNWTESNVDWNNQPAVSANVTDSVTTPSSASTAMEWEVRADVQDWYDGTTNNNGWRISDDDEGVGTLYYTNTFIDTLEFDAVRGKTPDIIPISGEVYGIVYTGSPADTDIVYL